jgi:hypothetical protein
MLVAGALADVIRVNVMVVESVSCAENIDNPGLALFTA